MNRLDDLRQSLEQHAALAPDALGVVDAARTGAVRIRRRRRIVAVTAAAVVVALAAAAVPVALHRQSAPPAPPAVRHPARSSFAMTLQLDPAYRADSIRRRIVPGAGQEIFVQRGSFSASVLSSYPGDEGAAGLGQQVTVGGHTATYVGGMLIPHRPAFVFWTAPGGIPIGIQSTTADTDRAALLALAGAVRIGPPEAVTMPFRLGPLPAGMKYYHATDYSYGPSEKASEQLIAVATISLAGVAGAVPLQVEAYRGATLLGTRIPDVAGHPAAWQETGPPQDFDGALTLQAGRCWFRFEATSAVTRAQVIRMAGDARYTDCEDRSTWVPLPG